MSIVFHLSSNGGFFSQLWRLTSNLLYARQNNLQFFIDDSQWMFKHTLGWRDYFTSLHVLSEQTEIPLPIHPECSADDSRLHQYTLQEHMTVCKEIYVLHDTLQEQYKQQKNKLSDKYYSIMIRRGDKMYGESMYVDTKRYVDELFKNAQVQDIFVQTDDYTAFQEVYHYCKAQYPQSNVLTTCPSTKRGAFVFNYQPSVGSNVSELNHSYLLQLTNISQKSVNSYSSNEMRDHVEEMLVGLQICMNSEYLCTDFQSNVTRYLVCCHKYPEHVIAIDSILPSYYSVIKSPAVGFNTY